MSRNYSPEKVIVLMGVSGSGKSTVGRLLAEKLGWKFYEADDYHSAASVEKMRSGTALDDVDRRLWLETLRGLIRDCLARGESAVLTCSALKKSYRMFLFIDERVVFIYLKGDYEVIQKRLGRRRGHFMNPTLLGSRRGRCLFEPRRDRQRDQRPARPLTTWRRSVTPSMPHTPRRGISFPSQ